MGTIVTALSDVHGLFFYNTMYLYEHVITLSLYKEVLLRCIFVTNYVEN